MMKKSTLISIILISCSIIGVCFATETLLSNTEETVTVMLRYAGESSDDLIRPHQEMQSNDNGEENRTINEIEVLETNVSEIELLKNDPGVEYVETDSKVKVSTIENQWFFEYNNINEIYNDLNLYGENVKVAILDTGISLQADRVVTGGINIIDADADHTDNNGHGSAMANLILDIAPRAEIYSVKVLGDDGTGYYSDIISGINWSVENNIDIICMSFGSFDYSYFLEEAIDTAFNSGVAMIAAAGNDASEKIHYPAAYNQVMSVGSLDENGEAMSFTNGIDKVDIFAPGINVSIVNHRGVKLQSRGTSVSAAQVVGVASLMLSAKPDYDVSDLYSVISHSATITQGDIKAINAYNALSNMNAFINDYDDFIPTLDKTYMDTENGRVAISYKINGYDNQYVNVNDPVRVRAGFYSDHDYCDITVYKSTNTSNILASERRNNIVGGAYLTYDCPQDVLSSAGTYKIRYHASGNGTNTAYDDVFTVYVENIPDDSYEPNNTSAAAYELSGLSNSINAKISSSSDVDFYKVQIEAGATIEINLTNLDRDYDLRLYRSDQVLVKKSSNSGVNDETITYTAITSGYHYIYVYGYGGACCSTSYNLSYEILYPEDEYETHRNGVGVTIDNNDTYTNYTNLSVTNDLTIYPIISRPTDEDWFGFAAPKGDVVITIEDLPLDYDIELYENSSSMLKYSYHSGTRDETVSYTVDSDYKYLYIRVYGYNGNFSTTPYTLTIHCQYINDVVVTPDKNAAGFSWTTGFSGTSVVQYGINSNITSQITNGTTWSKVHNLTATGLSNSTKYYYKVSTIGQARSASELDYFYTLDRYEDNNSKTSATIISSVGQEFNGTIHKSDDVDYFKVTLNRMGIMYLTLENVPAGCYYDLCLADQDLNHMASTTSYGSNIGYIEYLVMPGIYYITVDSFYGYKGDSTYLFTYDFDTVSFNDVYITDELHFGGDGTYSPTGNYSKTFSDLEFTNSAYDYYVGRTYNSKDKISNYFGRGWTFSFEGKVGDLERTFEYSNGSVSTYIDENYKMVKLPDATTYIFAKQPNGTFLAEDSRATLVKTGNTFVFTTKDKNVYIFNSNGYLTTMRDKYGNTMNITVNSSGKVQCFTDPTGNSYTITYGTNGFISSINENASGRYVSYQYTGNTLTSVVNPAGITTYYEYDEDGYLTRIRNNANISVESMTYLNVTNEPKKIATLTDGLGNISTYAYYPNENRTVITDSNGRTNTQSYDSTKFITTIIDAVGRTKTIQYLLVNNENKYGEITSETDEIGNITSYQRDDNGNITKRIDPDGSFVEYQYDPNDNIIWERDNLGQFTLYEYDDQGIKITKKAKYLEKVNPGATVSLTSSNRNLFAIEEYTYYADDHANLKGLLHTYKNPNGIITEYTYDTHGNPLTVKDPETGLTTNYTYNNLNYNLSKTTPMGYTTNYVYDNLGNLVKEINMVDGGISRTVYDSNGRKILEIEPQQYNASDDSLDIENNVNSYSDISSGTSYEYYSNGLLQRRISPEGDITEYIYDIYGNIISETIPAQYDENGIKKTEYGQYLYEYDNLNRLIAKKYKETLESGDITLETISYSTEQCGNEYFNVVSTTTYYDGSNSSVITKRIKYNDKVVSVVYDDGSSEAYSYYDDGELESVTDGNGNTTYYKYNSYSSSTDTTYNEVWVPTEGGYAYARTDYDLSGNKVAEYKSRQIVELNAVPTELYVKHYIYNDNGTLQQEYDSEGRKTEYEYDNDGYLTKESVYTHAENKNVVLYVNNDKGYPITQTVEVDAGTIYNDNRTNLVTSFVYDLNGNLILMTAPDGVVVSKEYDKQNRLIRTSQQVTDENEIAQNAVVEQRYNCNDEICYTKDAMGNEIYVIFDNRGLPVKQIDALGGVTANFYDYAGRLVNTVKPKFYVSGASLDTMNNTEYVYNNKNLVVSKIEHYTDSAERKNITVSQITYDANGNITSETDALGYVTSYTYTPMNKVKTILKPQDAEINASYSVSYGYNALGQAVTETNARGITTILTYDYMNNVIGKSVTYNGNTDIIETSTYDKIGNILTYTDGNGNIVTYTYNHLCEIESITYPADATIPMNTVTKKYGLNGKIAYEVDSLGTETVYGYNEVGKNTSVSLQNSSSAPLTSYFKYDLSGNKVKEIDGNGNVVLYSYDDLNRVVSVTKNGKTQVNSYDFNGNLISETDWRGNTTTYNYDALNRLIKTFDAYGKLISEKTYNLNGVQVSEKDAIGAITLYQYDKNNRLVAIVDSRGSTKSTTYDSDDNILTETNENGHTKTYSYDAYDNLISVSESVGGVAQNTSYTYDLCGNVLSVTDAEGNVTSMEYNAVDLIAKKIYPGGSNDANKQESYTYYADGSLATKTDRNGNTISYGYDIAGRQTCINAEGVFVSSTYDNVGNKLSVSNVTGNTVRAYDAEGRVITKVQPDIGTFTYSYDIIADIPQGEYAELSANSANAINKKVYDKLGRLHYVYDGEELAATYTYYDNGALQKILYGNGASEEYTYLSTGLLSTLVNKNASEEITDSYTYTYDAAGNQISKSEVISGVDKGTTSYSYDEIGQLVSVTEPSGKTTVYNYDKNGNRILETITEGDSVITTQYTYNEMDQLLKTESTYDDATVIYNYQYDFNGNLYSKTKETLGIEDTLEKLIGITFAGETEDGVSQFAEFYEYDALNQLVKLTKGNTTNIYTYNGEGMRVSKSVNGVATYYGYEYDKIVLEHDGTDFTAINLYGTNLISRRTDNQSMYYQFNGHADVVGLVDASGMLVASYYYDAFGIPTEQNGDIENPFRYGGYVYDVETGLYYIKSRFYDASIARFIQEDVYIGKYTDPLSLNLYTYVLNNPLRYLDPTGMIPDEIKVNGVSIGYLKGYQTGIYGSLRDLVDAYGGKITSKNNVYTAAVNGVTMTFDLNNKKLGNTYSFTIQGNKEEFEYAYFVLVKDVKNKNASKILVNIDSFTKAVPSTKESSWYGQKSSYAKPEKIYNSVNSLVNDIMDLENLAISYNSSKSKELVLQQIRRYNYSGGKWATTAGLIDSSFTKKVQNEKGYLNFYGSVKLKDPVTSTYIDVPHLAATLNTLVNNSNAVLDWGKGVVGAGGNEIITDDLSGWAGDLQSTIENLQNKLDEKHKNNYNEAYKVAKSYVGVGGNFSLEDMLADVDAVNLNAIVKDGNTVSTAFSGYYNSKNNTNKVKNRYTRFQYNQFGTTDKEKIRNYVDDYVKGGWYIMSNYKKREITEVERNALRDAFVNFIVNENAGK